MITPWPEKPEHTERIRGISANGLTFPESQKLLVLMYYERALAEAALTRLRYLVKVIRRYDSHADLHEALAEIGELPA